MPDTTDTVKYECPDCGGQKFRWPIAVDGHGFIELNDRLDRPEERVEHLGDIVDSSAQSEVTCTKCRSLWGITQLERPETNDTTHKT